jgi:hypothetical protein
MSTSIVARSPLVAGSVGWLSSRPGPALADAALLRHRIVLGSSSSLERQINGGGVVRELLSSRRWCRGSKAERDSWRRSGSAVGCRCEWMVTGVRNGYAKEEQGPAGVSGVGSLRSGQCRCSGGNNLQRVNYFRQESVVCDEHATARPFGAVLDVQMLVEGVAAGIRGSEH